MSKLWSFCQCVNEVIQLALDGCNTAFAIVHFVGVEFFFVLIDDCLRDVLCVGVREDIGKCLIDNVVFQWLLLLGLFGAIVLALAAFAIVIVMHGALFGSTGIAGHRFTAMTAEDLAGENVVHLRLVLRGSVGSCLDLFLRFVKDILRNHRFAHAFNDLSVAYIASYIGCVDKCA